MNVVLENSDSVKFFTDLRVTFSALGIDCESYDWYISDIETNRVEISEGWCSGVQLKRIIESNEIQFIWGVFSAFTKGVRVDVINPPFVYDNPSYWSGEEVAVQIPGALFEIAAWDSSATILVGGTPEMVQAFSTVFPEVKNLKEVAR